MYPQLSHCPVCGGDLIVSRLHCAQCDTTIEGRFQGAFNPFASLSPEQIEFVMAFVRCEGRLNRLEDELHLSYPTLRNRLEEIIRTLGYEPGRDDSPARLSTVDRKRILDDLEQGRITPAEAQALLRGKKDDSQA